MRKIQTPFWGQQWGILENERKLDPAKLREGRRSDAIVNLFRLG